MKPANIMKSWEVVWASKFNVTAEAMAKKHARTVILSVLLKRACRTKRARRVRAVAYTRISSQSFENNVRFMMSGSALLSGEWYGICIMFTMVKVDSSRKMVDGRSMCNLTFNTASFRGFFPFDDYFKIC